MEGYVSSNDHYRKRKIYRKNRSFLYQITNHHLIFRSRNVDQWTSSSLVCIASIFKNADSRVFSRRMCIPVNQENARKCKGIDTGNTFGEKTKIYILLFSPRVAVGLMSKFMIFFRIYHYCKKNKTPRYSHFVHNLGKVYPPHSFLIHRRSVKIIIGRPFLYQDNDTDEQFCKRCTWFVTESALLHKK